jgi:hypothetical protein
MEMRAAAWGFLFFLQRWGIEMSIFKLSAAANVVFLFLPVTMALIVAVSMQANPNSPLFYLGIFSMMVGWLLLVASKWGAYRVRTSAPFLTSV